MINSVPYLARQNRWFSEKYSEMIKIGYLSYLENISITNISFSTEFIKETILNIKDIALYDFPEIPTMKSKYTTKKYFEYLFKSSS